MLHPVRVSILLHGQKKLLRRRKDKQGERRAECEERDRVDGVVIYPGYIPWLYILVFQYFIKSHFNV